MMLLSRFFILLLCLAVLSLNEEAEGISGPYPGLKRGKFLKMTRLNQRRSLCEAARSLGCYEEVQNKQEDV
ncbi:hypothetical protein P5673_011974 [Acropora cervicornis]|uniref:Uncharacterized protein n=1 Tax=Acropora cervicornis TaxID=6130 RepID=A0AAD9V853_ACRCE|nr:hypothetical protein P5673_011974 [Acropora cervicornis]